MRMKTCSFRMCAPSRLVHGDAIVKSSLLNAKPLAAVLAASSALFVTIPSMAQTAPIPAPVSAPTIMSCVDGPLYQCSGGTSIRVDNGVALTSSGVQVYGRSTSDLANPNPNKLVALGLALASGGLADVRIAKDATGVITAPVLLLSNLGLTWDGKNERPLIIEAFEPTQGRTQLTAAGTIASVPLPPNSDQNFFDLGTKGAAAATQANYANNRYFPRATPIQCPAGQTCASTESAGLQYFRGDWRTGGDILDTASAVRLHSDGDARAGEVAGLPFPGTKGYRSLFTWNRQDVNLAMWTTQDTVQIAEWDVTGANEHNKIRRGVVAFGAVTDSNTVPAAGTATYLGTAYGWYAGNATEDPVVFHATASMVVNFVTRQVEVTIANAATHDAAATPLPVVALKSLTAMGAANTNVANYFTGPVNTGTLQGGVSGRYFGPIAPAGASEAGPAELGGAFSLSNATTGAALVAGFIARKL